MVDLVLINTKAAINLLTVVYHMFCKAAPFNMDSYSQNWGYCESSEGHISSDILLFWNTYNTLC